MTPNDHKEFDELLKAKLQNYVSPVPEHLWDEIERKQGFLFGFKDFVAANLGWLLLPFGSLAVLLLYFGAFNHSGNFAAQSPKAQASQTQQLAEHQTGEHTAAAADATVHRQTPDAAGTIAAAGVPATAASAQNAHPSGKGGEMAGKTAATSNEQAAKSAGSAFSIPKNPTAKNRTYKTGGKQNNGKAPGSNLATGLHSTAYASAGPSPDLAGLGVAGKPGLAATTGAPSRDLGANNNAFADNLQLADAPPASGKHDGGAVGGNPAQGSNALAAPNNMDFLQKYRLLQSLPPQLVQKQQFASHNALYREGKAGLNCYSFLTAPKRVSVDYLAGIGKVSRLMYARNGDEAYLHLRQDREVPQHYLSTGIRVGYSFKNAVNIRAGLMYTRLDEILKYTVVEDVSRTIFVTIDTIVVGIDTTFVVDTLSVIEPVANAVKKTNRYRFVDIPLTAGYDLCHNRWVFGINAGIMLNLMFAQEGEVFGPDEELVSLEGGDAVFRRSAGVSLHGSFSVGYKLTPRLQLLAEPTMRHMLKPLTKPNHPIEQRYFMAGLNAGLRVNF